MMETSIENALFFRQNIKNEVTWLINQYVDNFYQKGTEEFFEETDKSLRNIISKKREFEYLTFSGLLVMTNETAIHFSQKHYIHKLDCLESYCTYKYFFFDIKGSIGRSYKT